MSSTLWSNRQAKFEALLTQVDKAIEDLTSGTVDSYTIDDGQSRQVVTKINLPTLIQAQKYYLSQLKAIDKNLNPDLAKIGVAL